MKLQEHLCRAGLPRKDVSKTRYKQSWENRMLRTDFVWSPTAVCWTGRFGTVSSVFSGPFNFYVPRFLLSFNQPIMCFGSFVEMLIITRLDEKFSYVTWRFVDVNYVLGLLHSVDMSDVASVSGVHPSFIFRVEVSVTETFDIVFTICFWGWTTFWVSWNQPLLHILLI